MEKNSPNEPNQMNEICAALIESKMTGDEQEAKLVLESHQLLQVRSYMVETAVGARGVWTTLVIILDTDAGPNLIGAQFIVTT